MSADLHDQAMRAAERLRAHIVLLDNASVIRLELAARSMLENGCAVVPPVTPAKARALVTVYMADGDEGSFEEVVAAVRDAVTKNIGAGGCAVHMSEVTA